MRLWSSQGIRPKGDSAISPLTGSVNAAHPPDAPECQPSGCYNTPVGLVRPREEYFEARASLFVCFKDETCPRTEGGQGDYGARCLAAGAFIALART